MTIIIANAKGVWADRHVESSRSPHIAGYHAKKIHVISDDCVYACTGSTIKANQYPLIYRNFKDALLNDTPFSRLVNQDSDLHVFVYAGKVYYVRRNEDKIKLIDDPDDIVIGGSVEELAYLLHYDGLSPPEIISYISTVSNTVSAKHDCCYAEVK